MVSRTLLLFASRVGVGVGVVACGPSFQTIYEGDAHFEHCYALEENPNVALPQKGDCWRDWLAHYTYGQTHDRVMYAATRAQAIRRAPELPTDEAMMHAAPGERGQRDWAAGPAPTSAFTPPPKTWDTQDAGAAPVWTNEGAAASPSPAHADSATTTSSPPASADRPPLAACTGDCEDKWSACRGGCKGSACEACTRSYKGCIRNCAK